MLLMFTKVQKEKQADFPLSLFSTESVSEKWPVPFRCVSCVNTSQPLEPQMHINTWTELSITASSRVNSTKPSLPPVSLKILTLSFCAACLFWCRPLLLATYLLISPYFHTSCPWSLQSSTLLKPPHFLSTHSVYASAVVINCGLKWEHQWGALLKPQNVCVHWIWV